MYHDLTYICISLYSLKCMIATCEEFAKKHQITYNPTKSLCFNASNVVTPHIELNGQPVSVVHKDKHLGNYFFFELMYVTCIREVTY